jgi:membrane protease YdiL (CAAX protease family)
MNNRIFNRALAFPFFIYFAWILIWLIERSLAPYWLGLQTSVGQALYFLGAKLLIWVLPAVFLIKMSGHKFNEVMGLDRWPGILIWGGGAGAVLMVANLLVKTLITHQAILTTTLSWPLFNGVIVAPITEEIAFRGAILPGLQQKLSFFWANTICALLFMAAHLPGWYFQGRLFPMVVNPLNGVLTVFLLGWLFGYVRYRSCSVSAGILTHIFGNYFSW